MLGAGHYPRTRVGEGSVPISDFIRLAGMLMGNKTFYGDGPRHQSFLELKDNYILLSLLIDLDGAIMCCEFLLHKKF